MYKPEWLPFTSTCENFFYHLWVLLQELRSPPRWRMVTSGWKQACGLQTGWNQTADDWDSRNTTQLPPHQTIRGRSHTLQLSPQPNFAYKNSSPKTIREFGSFKHELSILLSWPCNKPFSIPNSNISVCLASVCIWHMNFSWTTATLPKSPSELNPRSSSNPVLLDFYVGLKT